MTFSQSLLDGGARSRRISQNPSPPSLASIGGQQSFTTQADIESNPLLYNVIKPVLEGREPNPYYMNVYASYFPESDDLNAQAEDDSISPPHDSANQSPLPPKARVPFFHRPPGSTTTRSLGQFDSVSSLNSDGEFYQCGRLDNLTENEESEEDRDEDPTERESEAGTDVNNSDVEDDSEATSTVIGPAMSRTVTPSTSRAQSPSSASAFGGYQSGYYSDYDLENMSSEWNNGSSDHDRDRERSPTPTQETYSFSNLLYESVSAPVRASSEPAPVTTPSRTHNTRSGQVPSTYVPRHDNPRRRRAGGGESISASPYARKERKGH